MLFGRSAGRFEEHFLVQYRQDRESFLTAADRLLEDVEFLGAAPVEPRAGLDFGVAGLPLVPE